MIVYVPGRMPNHVGPYGSARYPGTLLGTIPGYYNHPVSVYQHHPTSASAAPSPTSYYGSLNPHHLTTSSLDLPVWPRRMPVDEELAAATSPNTGLANLATSPGSTLANGGPPSPAHSDSDASSSSLELGSVRRGGNAQLKCRWQNCGRWFTSLEQLAGHVARLHAAPGPRGLFYCGWEGCARGERGFNARYKMLVHVRTHTNEKPHHCFQCDKSFSRAENLKIHARSHTGERPYVCPVDGCNKAYSNSSDRFKHTRTHAVDKPYCCKVPGCSKRYTDPSSLRKHVKTFRHYVNNNDKLQEKSFDESNNSQDKTNSSTTRFEMLSPEKNSNSTQSESEKKDSSMETSSSNNTSNSSSKASNSFEEQRKFVEWNNIYNNLERKEQEQVTPPKNNYETDIKLYPRIYEESYIIPDRIQVNPLYSKESSPHTSPLRIPDTYSRIGMQSTPIKIEESSALMEQQQQQQQQQPQPIPKVNTTVDYRNIESIVNSTPCKKENCDPIRHSVIKRAEDLKMEIEHQHSNHQHINPKHEIHKMSHKSVTDCCCHHKCCMHNNDSFLEKTKILSDLLLKAQNPLFRHLLNSSVDLQHGLQNMWSNITDSSNTCGQDLRVKHETIVTDMEQDLPLDLTINK